MFLDILGQQEPFMRGVSLTKVAAMLGDKIKTVEENYQHLTPDYLDDVHEP